MQHSRQSISPRGFRAALGGAAVALLLGAGLLTMTPQVAHAQAQNGTTITPLYQFGGGGTNPSNAQQAPTLGPDGNYYGVTNGGGANGDGTIYQMTPSGNVTVVYSFSGTDGSNPRASLLLGPDNNFYGTATEGGANGAGTVFKFTIGGTLTTLYSFSATTGYGYTNADGFLTYAPLVLGSDGALYGDTAEGGTTGDGVVYKITLSGAFTLLHTFAGGTDGANPESGFVLGNDGNLYGTTDSGGANSYGRIFEITPTGTLTTFYSFGGGTDAEDISGALVLAGDGNFYGLGSYGGANGNGAIFKVTPTGSESVIYSFTADNNGNADGAAGGNYLMLGTDGNLYGETYEGGLSDSGAIFEVSTSGVETSLYSFSISGNPDGYYPYNDSLVEGSNGEIYGLAEGGTNNDTVLFGLNVPSLTASVNPPPTAPPAPTVTGSGVRFDFNGDGKADLLWFNTASNALSIFDMNDTSVVSLGNTFAGPAPGSGWQPVASVDVNGDGFPDLMWWNNQTGELSDWTMDGNALIQANADFDTVPDTNWKPVAAADVVDNTSGNPPAWELVFQNTATGEISRWSMSGTTVVNYGGDLSTLGAGSPWQIVGAPDIDGDGKSDLLFWNNSTGEVSYWSTDLADSRVLSFNDDIAQVANTDWHLVGSEDTNGDGHSDLLWWNASTGELSRWLMNGTTVTSFGGDTLQVSDTTWQPTAIR